MDELGRTSVDKGCKNLHRIGCCWVGVYLSNRVNWVRRGLEVLLEDRLAAIGVVKRSARVRNKFFALGSVGHRTCTVR